MGKYYYKGYRIGSIEKNILQLLLRVKDTELPRRGFDPTFSDIFKTARQKAGFTRTFKQLKEKGLVAFQTRNGNTTLSLTEKGATLVEQLAIKKRPPSNGKKWDGKWRVIIFDIPEKRRSVRDMLRIHLKHYGFIQIQASVWAYPFPCKNIVMLIKTYFKLGSEVLFLVVESLEGDAFLRRIFKLPA